MITFKTPQNVEGKLNNNKERVKHTSRELEVESVVKYVN